MKAKVLVVENEIIVADHICSILKNLGYSALEPCLSYSEAVESILMNQPTIIFIDIQLAGQKDGIELARWIKANTNAAFLFLTSNFDQQTVQRAKAESPSAFLIKPFTNDEIKNCVENILAKGSDANISLFLKDGKVTKKVVVADILFLKSAHVYTEFYTTKEKVVVRGTLSEHLRKLPPSFVQTHRSYVVNTHYVEAFNTKFLTISTHQIPISAAFKASFFEKMK